MKVKHRHHFEQLTAALAVALLLTVISTACAVESKAGEARPSILWLTAEDSESNCGRLFTMTHLVSVWWLPRRWRDISMSQNHGRQDHEQPWCWMMILSHMILTSSLLCHPFGFAASESPGQGCGTIRYDTIGEALSLAKHHLATELPDRVDQLSHQ